MSKIGNCLLMLRILSSGRKYSISDLAERLEVSPRMIRSYKDELDEAGIYIDSVKGKHGGYIYTGGNKKDSVLPLFSIDDLNLLENIFEITNKNISANEQIKLNNLLDKIRSHLIFNDNYYNLNPENKYFVEILPKLPKIIENKVEIKLTYRKYNSNQTVIAIPRYVNYSNSHYYITCFLPNKNELRTYLDDTIIEIKEFLKK